MGAIRKSTEAAMLEAERAEQGAIAKLKMDLSPGVRVSWMHGPHRQDGTVTKLGVSALNLTHARVHVLNHRTGREVWTNIFNVQQAG
ncbi:MAG: hypothetical protein AAF593_01215 [Planctomycetota bacterium]